MTSSPTSLILLHEKQLTTPSFSQDDIDNENCNDDNETDNDDCINYHYKDNDTLTGEHIML